MINLRDLSLTELEILIAKMGEPKFRAKQVYKWIYKNIDSFREMKNLPGVFLQKLSETAEIGLIECEKIQESKKDGTKKYLFRLEDSSTVESVFMKYKYGNTICISSQVGCKMGCSFCASAIGGFQRNLSPGEMIAQLLYAEKDTSLKINHVVIMGMGEPFDNYNNLSRFLKIANEKEGLNMGMRNITVSTCGIVPMIEHFGVDFPQVNLAISLHGANNEIRSKMMPVNNSYPLENLLKAAKEYANTTSRRITFEYALVRGINDSKEDAKELAKQLKGILCHVNLITLNKVEETGFHSSSRKIAENFRDDLERMGIPTTIRRELGSDIDAACGQLRLKATSTEEEIVIE